MVPATQPTDRCRLPLLLAASGGVLDAVTYVIHHGVFASALSGNMVLLGITRWHRDAAQALRPLVPIIATLAEAAELFASDG